MEVGIAIDDGSTRGTIANSLVLVGIRDNIMPPYITFLWNGVKKFRIIHESSYKILKRRPIRC